MTRLGLVRCSRGVHLCLQHGEVLTCHTISLSLVVVVNRRPADLGLVACQLNQPLELNLLLLSMPIIVISLSFLTHNYKHGNIFHKNKAAYFW